MTRWRGLQTAYDSAGAAKDAMSMPDHNDFEERLKKLETTVGNWTDLIKDMRVWMHGTFDKSERALEAVTTLTRDRITRVIALAALAVALFAALYLCWHPAVISQENRQDVHVDRPETEVEAHNRRVRDEMERLQNGP